MTVFPGLGACRATVNIGSFLLERSDRVGGWTHCPSALEWELRDHLQRRANHSGLEELVNRETLDRMGAAQLVEHVCMLVEDGEIQAEWREFGSFGAPLVAPEPTIVEFKPTQPDDNPGPVEEPETWAPETDTTKAQVATLLAAARAGTPLCEVCERSVRGL